MDIAKESQISGDEPMAGQLALCYNRNRGDNKGAHYGQNGDINANNTAVDLCMEASPCLQFSSKME